MSLTAMQSPALGAPSEPQAPRPRLRSSWRAGWVALVITMLSRSALAGLSGLISTSLLPVIFGWHAAVVLSGSMEPRLTPGDIAVVRHVPPTQLHPGQVLLVHDPDHPGGLRLHRLVALRPDGELTLRGDANPHNDSSPVARNAVVGVAALHVPWVALPDYWLHERRFGAIAVLLLSGAAVLGGAFLHRPSVTEEDDEDGTPTAGPNPPAKERHRRLLALRRRRPRATRRLRMVLRGRVVTTATVAALITTAGLAPSAFATAFFKTTGNSGSAWSAVNYFSCKDAVMAAAPAMFYRLADSGPTTIADSVGTNTGTVQGSGTTFGVPGACPRDNNTGITLNGTSGWISTANSATNPIDFTLELWFKTTSTQGGDLISFGTSQTGTSPSTQVDRAVFLTKAGSIAFGMGGGNNNNATSGGTRYNDGQWHLLDAELSSTNGMTLYVDATDIATKGAIKSGLSQTGYWHIGYDDLSNMGNAAPGTNYFAGSLDEVAIYNTTLTAQQVKDHYYAS